MKKFFQNIWQRIQNPGQQSEQYLKGRLHKRYPYLKLEYFIVELTRKSPCCKKLFWRYDNTYLVSYFCDHCGRRYATPFGWREKKDGATLEVLPPRENNSLGALNEHEEWWEKRKTGGGDNKEDRGIDRKNAKIKKSGFFTNLWRWMTRPKQQWLRRQLKKRYFWLNVDCFTPLSARSPCCNVMVWRAERGGFTSHFCNKCSKRLTADFMPKPYGHSIDEVHQMMLEGPFKEFKAALAEHGNNMKTLRPAIKKYLFDFFRITSLLN